MTARHIRTAWTVAAFLPIFFFSPVLRAQNAVEPVVVTATRQAMRVSELLSDVTVIEREDIERHAGSTMLELLAEQPGLQLYRSGGLGAQSGFFLRGAQTGWVKVLVDGMPISDSRDQTGSSALGDIPLSNVERIEVVRGPASALYGADALGGVIQIFTRKATEPGVKADAFVGGGSHATREASAGVSAAGEIWKLRVEGHKLSTDGISAYADASNRDADKDGYDNSGAAFSFSVTPLPGHEVGMSYRTSQGRFYYDGGEYPPPDFAFSPSGDFNNRQDFRSTQWRLHTRNRLSQAWESTLSYGVVTDKRKDYNSFQTDGRKTEIENRLLGWQNDIALAGPVPGQVLLAAELLKQHGAPAEDFAGGKDEMDNTSVLAGWTANAGAHRWQANTRHDDHSAFGGHTTHGLAYGYQISPHWRAQASYGTAFKAPTLSELYAPVFGNPDLKPEKSRNYEAGLAWETDEQRASFTTYHQRVRNLIGYDPVTFQDINVAQEATLEGVTLAWSGRLDTWRWSASYDRLNAVNEDTNEELLRRAKHSGLLSLSKRMAATDATLTWRGAGKRKDVDNNGDSATLDPYGLFDASVRYAVSPELSIEGRIDNLLDHDYELAKGYGTPGRTYFVGLRYLQR